MVIDLESLNEAQRHAVTTADASTVVVAGPGTGKTHTLSFRAAYLLAQEQPSPSSLLALTFTYKAAHEMAERVKRLLGSASLSARLWVGTFHALGLRILREEGQKIGYGPELHILSPGEQVEVVKEVLTEKMPHEPLQRASKWVRRLSVFKQRFFSAPTTSNGENFDLKNLLYCYEARLRELKVIDFDDLVLKPLALLREVPSVRERYQSTYRHLLVDEYQDTNDAQCCLLRELTGPESTLWVIGDADQAIYAFRGAGTSECLGFQKIAPHGSTIHLETNYRSTRSILVGAQAVISHNRQRIPHRLRPTRLDDAPIFFRQASDARTEAHYVAKEAARLVGGLHMNSPRAGAGDCGFSDIAVLYRLHQLARPLADAFARAGIPYQVVGGISANPASWSESVLGFLRCIINPHDNLSLCTLLQCVGTHLDFPSLRRLVAAAAREGVSLYSFLQGAQAHALLDVRQSKATRSLLRFLRVSQEESLKKNLSELLGLILGRLKESDLPGEDQRAELFNLAHAYSQGPAQAQLSPFLERAMLAREGETYNPQAEAVTLMTMHAAKGLEFPVVFMIGLESGISPCTEWGEEPSALEEERRLFYVGMTRAKQRLYLSCAQQRYLFGKNRVAAPSPFLAEIPSDLIERIEERPHPTSSANPKAKQRSLFS